MLLLSSATRILTTERPPPIICLCWPHPCAAAQKPTPAYWSTRFSLRQSQQGRRVSEVNTALLAAPRTDLAPKTRGVRPFLTVPRSASPDLRPAPRPYQGTIFFRPFFFLLVDSFLVSPLDPFCFPSCAGASVLAASLVWPAVAGVSSVLGVASAVPFAEFSFVAGAFGSPCAAGPASPPPDAPFVLPTFMVATIPVVAPTPCDGFPPLKTSIPVSLSESGVIVGCPVVAAARNSCPGPVRIRLSGFLTNASRSEEHTS